MRRIHNVLRFNLTLTVPSPLNPPKKASASQIEIWSTRNQCSWWALCKNSAYILQLLLAPVKARYLHIKLLLVAPLKTK